MAIQGAVETNKVSHRILARSDLRMNCIGCIPDWEAWLHLGRIASGTSYSFQLIPFDPPPSCPPGWGRVKMSGVYEGQDAGTIGNSSTADILSSFLASIHLPMSTQTCISKISRANLSRLIGAVETCLGTRDQMFPPLEEAYGT